MHHLSSAFFGVLVASILQSTSAQTSGLFTWKFTDTVKESVTECGSLPITLSGGGKAPYYMIAFAVDGTPSTSLIGSDSGSLAWVVNQPAGTKLLLNVVDSDGSSGGTSASLYTVTSGQSTSCLPQTTSGFSLSSNATSGEISTCDPWGLIIEGGQSPYTVSLAAEGSPSVTNVTMSPGDNLYTYINRAGPNGALLAAISDSAGKWASGASYVKTKGSTDTTCSGAISSSGKTKVDEADPTTSKPSTTSDSKTTMSDSKTTTTASLSSTTWPDASTSSSSTTGTATTPTNSGTSDAATPSQTNGDMTLRVHSIVSLLAAGVMMKLFF